jgi:hypothetical protein
MHASKQTKRVASATRQLVHNTAVIVRPTQAQRRYLLRGLTEPGGKLPLLTRDGRELPRPTTAACIAHGWAEPWFNNPIKPNWLVCRLTPAGYRVLDQDLPENRARARRKSGR